MAMSIYHMPVSKVLKSKVKKTLLKIATRVVAIEEGVPTKFCIVIKIFCF